MTLIHPYMLWGLLGVGVPILIHLLSRFRYRSVEWGAMELLQKALQVRGRQVNLEDYILLALRCLAVLLMALAFTRPTIRMPGERFGGGAQGVLILLDGSYSMAHQAGVDDRFGMGKQIVRDILKNVSPGVPLTFALMGDGVEGSRRRVLYRNMQYDPERMTRILGETQALPESLRLETCLEDGLKLMKDMGSIQKECYIIGDLQARDWEQLSQKAKTSLTEMSTLGSVAILPCAAGAAENVVLTRFWLHSGMLREGGMARYAVEVRNNGNAKQERVAVSLAVNDEIVDERVIPSLDAGMTKTVFLFARFEQNGATKIVARLNQDALSLDNVRYAVAHVRESVNVLCVDGDPTEQPRNSETYFLSKSLAPRKNTDKRSAVQLTIVPWLAFSAERLSEYDIVFLANVADLPENTVATVHRFVKDGGGLVILLGDKITPNIFNGRMKMAGDSFMPGELLEAKGNAETQKEYWRMALETPGHPVARPLGLLGDEILGDCLYFRYFPIKPHPDAQVILSLQETKEPLLLERRVGLGRVMLYASTADRAWTNAPIKPVMPILLHRMLTYLTERDHADGFLVSHTLQIHAPPAATIAKAVFADPSGEQTVVRLGPDRVAELSTPPLPGFYPVGFLQEDTSSADVAAGAKAYATTLVAVNIDPAEADVHVTPTESMMKQLDGLPVDFIPGDGDLSAKLQERRVGRELWWLLLLLATVALVAELLLARMFARRMREGRSPVGASLFGREHADIVTMPSEGGTSR